MRSLAKLTASLAIFGATMASSPAFAGGEIIDSIVSTCTVNNCSTVILDGNVKSIPATATVPSMTGKWVGEVFARANECLRVAVVAQSADFETTVVSPDGTVWRNDDFGGTLFPRVAINGTPTGGWYTVSISHFSGAPVTGTFGLRYGRYPLNNPNCAAPTTTLSLPTPLQAAADAADAQKRTSDGLY